DDEFDIIMPIFVPPVTCDQLEVAQHIRQSLEGIDKSVYACFMGAGESTAGIDHLKEHNIPVYIYPEAIAKTLATIHGYKSWLARPLGKVRTFKVDKNRVQKIIKETLKGKEGVIVGDEALDILSAYGVQVAGYRYADTADQAAAIAREISYPVVMKIATPAVVHKTEVGGVIVDLRSDGEVEKAFEELKSRVGKLKKGEHFSVAVQQMITGGIETVIGMTTDPSFGPLIMFGLGGIYVEVMKDVAFRINPLTDQGTKEMIESLRSYPLLTGFRGAPPVDIAYIEETLLRISQLIKDFDCFVEIDVNPFIVSPEREKCAAVDARFVVHENSK
ncbi:MAG: acetate--CoA ligase family protein, partial [Candidatus Aminicenantes bacterium]|nr:acetate--CoA ligase family protein [Candidatus Aminicenantes bacterium]